MKADSVPSDSVLRDWLTALEITEVPTSYAIASGLSLVGSLLKRFVYVDQVRWKVYPNLSILLVGPSGIGKDTAIDAAEEVVVEVGTPPVLGGKTMDTIFEQMTKIGDPACALIPAPEITAFLGGKDYQKSMVQEITHILSTKAYHDISTKSDWLGTPKRIPRPTVTMMAGSTEEWLHKAMPDGSMEGGLWPRFLIVREEYGGKMIPLVGDIPKKEIERALAGRQKFIDFCKTLPTLYKKVGGESVALLEGARFSYTNWYHNRFKYFSPVVRPYANRSRDQVLRLALLMAITRGHNYVEEVDVEFGATLMNYVAQTIEKALKPPTREAQVAQEILKLLPAKHMDIVAKLSRTFTKKDVVCGEELLIASGRMKLDQGRYVEVKG